MLCYLLTGCTNLYTTLAEMSSSCVYRQCAYGAQPWIDTSGILQISAVPVECPTGSTVPLNYTSGGTFPCTDHAGPCAG